LSKKKLAAQGLELAVRAAREAGSVLSRGLGRAERVTHKGFRDLVTELDLASQQTIVSMIQEAFPEHRIIAEEDSGDYDLSGPTWIVDPLDGTTNFVHGLPIYCVSIGLALDGELLAGVIYDPERDELFSARAGQGASLNDRPLKVSGVEELSQALVVTGFAYNLEDHLADDLKRLESMLVSTQGIRRLGSAALDLAYVASGRMDSFWEVGLHPWDLAAGALLVKEAGGRVTDMGGAEFAVLSGRILASNGLIHGQMVEGLKT
jgi:myo-inositol-1(or 4)-monophosphatase